jgi:E3 ubiquitin-protein ligase UBR3
LFLFIYHSKVGLPNYKGAIQEADAYLKMLLDLNNMGALMRCVMTTALTNPQKYRGLMDPSSFTGQSEYDNYCQDSNKIYQDAIKALPNPEPPHEYKGKNMKKLFCLYNSFLSKIFVKFK